MTTEKGEIYLPDVEALSWNCYMLKCMKTTEENNKVG